MELTSALLHITKHVLGIYETKESRKYLERILYLEKLLYAEEAKHPDERNHAVMDNIDFELCLIARHATGLKASKA